MTIQSKTLARWLSVGITAMLAAALFAPVASADTPNPGYEQFAGCPSKKEKPTVSSCFRSVVDSGHLQMGNKDTPITVPIELNGGYNEFLEDFSFTSKGGLRPAKQTVPGGVTGLTGLTWLLEFFGVNALSLYATTELAGTPGNPLANPFTLPIKVHLETPSGVLGKNCYIGSNSNPIKLNLTFFTTSPPPPNKPISGKFPEFKADPEGREILHIDNGTLVDNAFAAPGANGCVLTLFGFIPISINGLVNSQSGLPSPAGTNETIQNADAELVNVERVYP